MNAPWSEVTKSMDLVCLGEPMVEFNQTPEGTYHQGFGGDTSNCAISAARQIARVGYISRIGTDKFGDSLIKLWKSENIDTSGVIRDPEASTGIYFVTHDQEGHHFTYYRKHSAASRMCPADLSEDYIAQAKILHVSAISQAISETACETVLGAIEMANKTDTLVAYDTNLRLNLWSLEKARDVIHSAMQKCHIALPSYEDACLLTGHKNPEAIVDFYFQLGAKMVLLKLGKDGVIAATPDSRNLIPPLNVNCIDANAAGDTFAGAFLAEYCQTENINNSAEYANTAAALSTQKSGAISSIPGRKEVLAKLVK